MSMKILISVPSGYHAREILFPLQSLLTDDPAVSAVAVLTPAAPWQRQLFPDFPAKFSFHANPANNADHDSLLSRLSPDVVLTPTNGLDLKDTPILLAARRLSIPSVTFISSWDNVFKIDRLLRHGHARHTRAAGAAYALPDYFAVWNQFNADHLMRLFPNFDPNRITITGPPRFDYFTHTPSIPSKADLFAWLDIKSDPATTHLIHCATTKLYPFSYIIKKIHQAAPRQLAAPVTLYASVHPGGNMSKHLAYRRYGVTTRYSFGRRDSSPHPDFLYLPTSRDIYCLVSLFKHSSLLINQSSTVAIESMCADVPVINVMYGQPFDWWRWHRSMVYRDFRQHYRYITDYHGTTLVKNSRSLIPAINNCLTNPSSLADERALTVEKLITYTDGSCSRRLLEVVKNAIHTHRSG